MASAHIIPLKLFLPTLPWPPFCYISWVSFNLYLYLNILDPADHFFSYTHSLFHRICDILSPGFPVTPLVTSLNLFLGFSSSAHLLYAESTQASMQDPLPPFTSNWSQRIIWLKVMGWESTCQKCRLVSCMLYLLNKTLWSWYLGFWILSGLLGKSYDPKVRESFLN